MRGENSFIILADMRSLLIFIIAAAAVGCSSRPGAEPPADRPGHESGEEAVPDYSEILADRRVRFVSDTISIYYDDGGVLYSVIDDNIYKFIDVTSGYTIALDLTDSTLTVNGARARVDKITLAGREGDLKWYVIEPGGEVMAVE